MQLSFDSEIPWGHKKCTKCNEVKPWDNFQLIKSRGTRKSICRLCIKLQMNEWRKGKRPSQSLDVLQWRRDNWLRLAVTDAKKRAKRKGIEFDLNYKDIEVPATCPLLGIPLFRVGGKATDNTPSLDRIDNARGYTKDNVWVISWRANSIKRDSTPSELVQISTVLASMFPELTNAPN